MGIRDVAGAPLHYEEVVGGVTFYLRPPSDQGRTDVINERMYLIEQAQQDADGSAGMRQRMERRGNERLAAVCVQACACDEATDDADRPVLTRHEAAAVCKRAEIESGDPFLMVPITRISMALCGVGGAGAMAGKAAALLSEGSRQPASTSPSPSDQESA